MMAHYKSLPLSKLPGMDLSSFSRQVQSENAVNRRIALETLHKSVFDYKFTRTDEEYLRIWEYVRAELTKSLIDTSESCRSASIELWKKFIVSLPPFPKNIDNLIPTLWRRLSFQELHEPSEEVRLNYVQLLHLVILNYTQHLATYATDLLAIFARTLTDNYPAIKSESSACVEELTISFPAQFYSDSDCLIKPILSNFSHQHHKVRVASIRAIGKVLLQGNSKSMEEVSTPLAQRLFDQCGTVRLAVIEVAGQWFVELRDRYSWWHKLIPLLATGLHDELEQIRTLARKLWDAAGKLYIQENQEDEKFKDKMDFLTQHPEYYPRQFDKCERPNLGCRVIVQQNFGKLVVGIVRELADWLPDVRVRSAQLLCVLVFNAEEDVTQYIEKLLPAMYRACNDEDPRVVENIELAAEYMGHFVLPSIYWPLMKPTLEDNTTTIGHLKVLAAIIRGSEGNFDLYPQLPAMLQFLLLPSICRSYKIEYQQQLLACCDSIIEFCNPKSPKFTSDLYVLFFTLLATCEDDSLIERAVNLLTRLSKIEETEVEKLHVTCLPMILKLLEKSPENWSIHCFELKIFRGCLTWAPIATWINFNLIVKILKEALTDKSDPEVRLKLLIILAEYFENKNPFIVCQNKAFVRILEEIVYPELIWKAGRTAEATRTAAICCLCALVDGSTNYYSHEIEILHCPRWDEDAMDSDPESIYDFSRLIIKNLPLLVTLVDDNAKKTRLYALRAICSVMKVEEARTNVNEQILNTTYPAVLKRLDDGCDSVRAGAVEALVQVWAARSKHYDLTFNRSHVDYLYTTGIVHLDDPDTKFQQLMLDALLELAKIHPELLATKIDNCKENFRNRKGLDKLLAACHDLLLRSK